MRHQRRKFQDRINDKYYRFEFPQFTNKRKLDKTSLHINPNEKQHYKIIFGLDFLIENKFDFLLSTETIKWQVIEIPIHNNDTPRKKNE